MSELVRLHKGRIRIQSAPEIGTRVTVTLPHGERKRGRPLMDPRGGGAPDAAGDIWAGV